MPTLMPWTIVEIGDLDVFSPALPSLVVYTWYVDDEPESSVTHFWRDEDTGTVHHELVLVAPVPFTEAVTRAEAEAPKRSVERIHVKHARTPSKPAGETKAKRAAKKARRSRRSEPSPNARRPTPGPTSENGPPEAILHGRLRPAAPIGRSQRLPLADVIAQADLASRSGNRHCEARNDVDQRQQHDESK